MSPSSEPLNDTLTANWIEQQRERIEGNQQRAQEALTLFRQATAALPKLAGMLRDQKDQTKKLQARLEQEGTRILRSLSEAGAEQTRSLVETGKTLASEACQTIEAARLQLEEAFPALTRRLAALETGLGQDRMAMNKLNQRLLAQAAQLEAVSNRLATLEEEQRASQRKAEVELLLARQNDESLQGSMAQVQGQLSRVLRFLSWFASARWWKRAFEVPPGE